MSMTVSFPLWPLQRPGGMGASCRAKTATAWRRVLGEYGEIARGIRCIAARGAAGDSPPTEDLPAPIAPSDEHNFESAATP
jgi:hypothetical protein